MEGGKKPSDRGTKGYRGTYYTLYSTQYNRKKVSEWQTDRQQQQQQQDRSARKHSDDDLSTKNPKISKRHTTTYTDRRDLVLPLLISWKHFLSFLPSSHSLHTVQLLPILPLSLFLSLTYQQTLPLPEEEERRKRPLTFFSLLFFAFFLSYFQEKKKKKKKPIFSARWKNGRKEVWCLLFGVRTVWWYTWVNGKWRKKEVCLVWFAKVASPSKNHPLPLSLSLSHRPLLVFSPRNLPSLLTRKVAAFDVLQVLVVVNVSPHTITVSYITYEHYKVTNQSYF